jgi:hypothetical protein
MLVSYYMHVHPSFVFNLVLPMAVPC